MKLRAWRLAISGPLFYSYLAFLYLMLLRGASTPVVRTLLLLVAIIVYFANGFLINDLADRANDQAAGVRSESRGHTLSVRTMVALIILTGVISAALAVVVQGDAIFYGLWVIAFALSIMYSTPPIAFKRRGISGAVCDSLIERPLPILIIFSFFGYYGVEMVLFPILSELTWSVFKHQIADYEGDKVAGVKTLAVRLGKERSLALLKWFLNPVGIFSQVLLLLIIALTVPDVRLVIEILIVVYATGAAAAAVAESRIRFRTTITDPPYIMFSNFAYKFLILPVLALAVTVRTPQSSFILVALALSLIPHVRDYVQLIPAVTAQLRPGSRVIPA